MQVFIINSRAEGMNASIESFVDIPNVTFVRSAVVQRSVVKSAAPIKGECRNCVRKSDI